MPISITNEKRIIVDSIIKAIVITGFALNAITAVRDLQAGTSLTNIMINSSVLIFFLFVLVIGKKIHYEIKAGLIIGFFILIGIKYLLLNGISGGTFYFFLISSIIILLIFNWPKAIYSILIASLLYLIFSALMAFEVYTPIVESSLISIKVRWLGEVFSYIFLLFITIGGVGRLQRSFISSIAELDESNQKLNQYNEELRNQLEQIKEMENKVARTEINFKKVFEESNDGIIICDPEGRIIESNQSIAAMLEYPKSYLIGHKASDFIIPDDKRSVDQLSIDKIHRAKIRELHLVDKNSHRIPVEIHYSVIILNEEKAILVTIRDTRERKQAEQKVLNAVIQAEENERSRFAKDLHDDLGPIMSSIKMYIQSLRYHEDSEDKKELINRLLYTVDDSIKSIRRISYNLSSHLLQNMGLINALKTHVDRINLSDSLQITLTHNFENSVRLASNIEIVTYRVILELINNSIKHSQGTAINIELMLNQEQFIINYSDNGIGFDIDKMLHDNSKGIGLRNILSRIKSIKGILNFETTRNGFSLSIDISL